MLGEHARCRRGSFVHHAALCMIIYVAGGAPFLPRAAAFFANCRAAMAVLFEG
jgi:hypothetical protein